MPDSLSPALLGVYGGPPGTSSKTDDSYSCGAYSEKLSGKPCFSASARTNALKVYPAWKPLEPPVARLTLVLKDPGASL